MRKCAVGSRIGLDRATLLRGVISVTDLVVGTG